MRRIVWTLVAGVGIGLSGCGQSEPVKSAEELNAAQAKDQQQADDAERQMRKDTQGKKKK